MRPIHPPYHSLPLDRPVQVKPDDLVKDPSLLTTWPNVHILACLSDLYRAPAAVQESFLRLRMDYVLQSGLLWEPVLHAILNEFSGIKDTLSILDPLFTLAKSEMASSSKAEVLAALKTSHSHLLTLAALSARSDWTPADLETLVLPLYSPYSDYVKNIDEKIYDLLADHGLADSFVRTATSAAIEYENSYYVLGQALSQLAKRDYIIPPDALAQMEHFLLHVRPWGGAHDTFMQSPLVETPALLAFAQKTTEPSALSAVLNRYPDNWYERARHSTESGPIWSLGSRAYIFESLDLTDKHAAVTKDEDWFALWSCGDHTTHDFTRKHCPTHVPATWPIEWLDLLQDADSTTREFAMRVVPQTFIDGLTNPQRSRLLASSEADIRTWAFQTLRRPPS